jgi:hypothetical protein
MWELLRSDLVAVITSGALDKFILAQLIKKFHAFYAIQILIIIV